MCERGFVYVYLCERKRARQKTEREGEKRKSVCNWWFASV